MVSIQGSPHRLVFRVVTCRRFSLGRRAGAGRNLNTDSSTVAGGKQKEAVPAIKADGTPEVKVLPRTAGRRPRRQSR